MAKFKLMQRVNPAKRDDPMKWYAIPYVYDRLDTHSLSKEATENTTLAPMEFEGTMNVFAQALPKLLLAGYSVKVNGLGTFRLSFGSEGVEDITKFKAAEMIKNLRIIFTPDKQLQEDILSNVTFENAGVVEDGFTYPSLKDYLKKVVSDRPATGDGGNSGGTGGGDDGPGMWG